MEWWSVEGHDAGSGVSKMETTANRLLFYSSRQLSQHTQNPHSHT